MLRVVIVSTVVIPKKIDEVELKALWIEVMSIVLALQLSLHYIMNVKMWVPWRKNKVVQN